ncbi:MAG TPA: cbb3-type cytochrome c oxidase subunit I [Candidatus Saccharimonadales bacterium]|nr:cbb3-type cytochrome c oxidase subunit I [Candidatus Saccharimonadales bacterium]
MFGRLTFNDLPHEWFTIGGTVFITLMGLGMIVYITRLKKWKWLWNNWLTSTDPKKIGVMYIIVAFLMLFRGGLDAGMIWLQQALSSGSSHGYLSADHFQQIFTAHGNIMVFFVTMGFLFGLINIIVPLQIGARDLASPFLNTLGFWLYVAGVVFINLFFVIGGEFAATGWLAIAPLSEAQFSPGVGVDYWIWSLQISGLGTLLGGINFIMTILKMRAPGMTLMKMPLFTWTSLCSMVLIISVFPILTVTIALLSLDRMLGMHFFTTGGGGNPMMYVNLIWMWGHPEVYILMLPAFGIYSEVVSTFSQKRLAGYVSLVIAAIGITLLALLVWLHHFFTMGAGADVNAFFGIMTMFIAIPTGVQIFNWIATMHKGRIRFFTPMLWFFGFVSTFTFGGLAGVILGIPGIDFQLHNTLFLVAHFHTMVIGGALFGIFAGITYWFPKVTGFTLNERLGRYAFWLWIIGFFTSFTPLYILGFMGATRRLDHYDASTGWQPLFIVALVGVIIIACAIVMQVLQIIVSIIQRKENRGLTGDPWNGRTLEWATASPPPFYNFAIVPVVTTRDAFWEMKKHLNSGKPAVAKAMAGKYEDIHMPKNTALGMYISGFVFAIGFAMVWHIYWFAIVGLIGAIACVVIRTFDEDTEYVLTAKEVEKIETERLCKSQK